MLKTEFIEQTSVQYNINDDSSLFEFNIDGLPLIFTLEEGNVKNIILEQGDMYIKEKDNICKELSMSIGMDIIDFQNIIIKTPQYRNFKYKIEPDLLANAIGTELVTTEYILKPELSEKIVLKIENKKWLEFSELEIEQSLDLSDTSNYYINDITFSLPESSDEISIENVFLDTPL